MTDSKTTVQRLNAIDIKLDELRNTDLNTEFLSIINLSGPKFYIKLNAFEKKIGIK